MAKYIFVTGGVISSLGKGTTSASLGRLIQARGFRVVNVKCEMYVNVDAGTIRPTEHGEVFVTDDGIETDQDIGTYERFLNTDLSSADFLTTGQIYQEVIQRERNFEYEGEDVEVVPHVPEEIIRRLKKAAKESRAEFVIVEFGGTVGEYQGVLFLEAARMMTLAQPDDVAHVHVSYLPIPKTVGEMKTKPVQYSVRTLNSHGIQPDFIVGRAERPLDQKRKEKLQIFCAVPVERIMSNPDAKSIYEVPLILEKQHFADQMLSFFNLKLKKKPDLKNWKKLVKTIQEVEKEVKIGVVGKYFATGEFQLEDSYVSVIEAIKHAAWAHHLKPVVSWYNAEEYEKNPQKVHELSQLDGVIIPGGYGARGTEGKMIAVNYLRENKIPFLGLCYGLQMAVIEFARNVCGLTNANSKEINPKTKYPVIDIMEEQKKLLAEKMFGGTNRLGAYKCKIKAHTQARKYYHQDMVSERHRHRYEVNNKYRSTLEKNGLIVSGTNPKADLVEIIELPSEIHPWFVATQFHPEFKSRPEKPHPLYMGFLDAAKARVP